MVSDGDWTAIKTEMARLQDTDGTLMTDTIMATLQRIGAGDDARAAAARLCITAIMHRSEDMPEHDAVVAVIEG